MATSVLGQGSRGNVKGVFKKVGKLGSRAEEKVRGRNECMLMVSRLTISVSLKLYFLQI